MTDDKDDAKSQDEKDDETIGEDLVSWEIVNLAQEVGDPPPPALAWISLNGHVFETDTDVLEKIATEAKAARNGLGGRGGSSIKPKELANAARQRTIDWQPVPREERGAGGGEVRSVTITAETAKNAAAVLKRMGAGKFRHAGKAPSRGLRN